MIKRAELHQDVNRRRWIDLVLADLVEVTWIRERSGRGYQRRPRCLYKELAEKGWGVNYMGYNRDFIFLSLVE